MPLSVTRGPGAFARRWSQLAAAVFMLAVLTLLGSAASASAHQTSTTLAGDGSFATLYDGFVGGYTHDALTVCDQDVDGNYAYVRRVVNGVTLAAFYDADGAGGVCSTVQVNPTTLDSYNICVQNEGCGAPVYRSQF